MKVSDEERLKVIKSTPYFISENTLVNDLKWLIERVEENERLNKIIEAYDKFEDSIIDAAHKTGNSVLEEALAKLRENLKK